MPHRAVCQSWRWLQTAHPYYESDRVLHKASLSFDVSSRWELFWPLMAGACVVFAKPQGEKDSAYLAQLIQQEQITVSYFVATLLSLFLETPGSESCTTLRQMFVGGEAFPFALKQRVWQQFPACDAIEIYGSTETIVVSSWHCQPEPEPRRFALTQPICQVPIRILDDEKQPVPAGEIGELYVGGDYLVRGYLNRPELTAERFIPDPFETDLQQGGTLGDRRLYKTGDLARLDDQGRLELLGRSDHQVKLRGFRVELGEIEALLVQHPEVRQAAVILREDVPGDQRLVAYITSTIADNPEATVIPALRLRLQTTLPDYMRPSAFVVLEEFPRTPNGKLDRLSLPSPAPTRPSLSNAFVQPQTEVERELAGLWSQLLQVHPIGTNDDFFELGGNSLLTMRLLFQVQHQFQVEISLPEFLAAPTIAVLVNAIALGKQSPTITGVSGMTVAELGKDVILEPEITPENFQGADFVVSKPQGILLTGATGFLGAFLLAELMERTSAQIYCLVRGCSMATEATQKILRNCDRYQINHSSFGDRIVPILGDLAKPKLGLNTTDFNQLAQQVEVIFHAATFLNLAYPYTMMKAANVGGAKTLIQLACQGTLKPIHFVSTPAVLKSTGYLSQPLIHEDASLDACEMVYGGYGQSKWVAEQLLQVAATRGVPISIYRPGTISGHSQTGAYNADQTLGRLLKSFIDHGIAPDLEIAFDLTPVDYVSQAIYYLSQQPSSRGQTFHLVNPQCWMMAELSDRLTQIGYPVRRVPYVEWQRSMEQAILDTPDHILSPLLPFLTQKIVGHDQTYLEASSFMERLGCDNAVQGLATGPVRCPLPDNAMLERHLHW